MTAKKRKLGKSPLPKSNENWKILDPKDAKREIRSILSKKKSGQKVSGKVRKGAQGKPGIGKKPVGPVKQPPEPVKKRGHPPIPYYPERHPEWVRGLASRGSTVIEICEALGISRFTLYAWEKKHPDFSAALQVGRNETVARLHNAMVKKAQGFTQPLPDEVKTTINPDGTRTIQTIKKEVYFPPDVGAAKMLLVNLDPAFKTERTENALTGADGGPVTIVHQYRMVKGLTPPDKIKKTE